MSRNLQAPRVIHLQAWGFLLWILSNQITPSSAQDRDWLTAASGLGEVPHSAVSLTGGFWGPRLKLHHETTLPHVLDRLEERHHLTNFDKAAVALATGDATRQKPSTDDATAALAGNSKENQKGNASADDEGIVGHSAFDSDVHKALEGACHSLCHHNDPALRKRVDGMLDRIIAAQQDDSYLVSYFIAKEPENRWANMRLNHELYNAGHFFEFAVAHHQLTGSNKALEAAKRFADHIDQTFGPGKRYETGGHQGIELALVKLFRQTGETRYLDLCRFFLEERGHLHGNERKPFRAIEPRGDPPREPGQSIREWRRMKWSMRNGRMQDHLPVLKQFEAVGHAVRATYMYAAMADLARFDEAPEYARATRILWDDVIRRKLYLTGGLGTAQYGDEGFGDPYLLPNKTYCESCASIGHVLWQHRMALLEEDSRFADVMELALYNSAIAGMSLEGNRFSYQNPLQSEKGSERSDWIGLACCPTNHARFTPQVGGFMYAHNKGKLHVNLYASGTAEIPLPNGQQVRITQETDYPWDGMIRLTLHTQEPTEIDLRLRIPGWARNQPVPGDLYTFANQAQEAVSLSLNGVSIDSTPSIDGYLSIKRMWQPGDSLALHLPMPVRRVRCHRNVVENQGRVALMRGPMVYCLEGIDHPGTDVSSIQVPEDTALKAEHRNDLLHGVTVVTGEAKDGNGKLIPITAIPYYAWANRGKTPMNLWLRASER